MNLESRVFDKTNAMIVEFTQKNRTGVIQDLLRGDHYFLQGRRVRRTTFLKNPETAGVRTLS